MRRIIGIIGGMGPEAGVEFQRRLIDVRRGGSDQSHLPLLFVSDPAIPDRTKSLQRGDTLWVQKIIDLGKKLEVLGATHIVIVCNTAHTRLAEIRRGLSVPVIDMIALTAEYLAKIKSHRVGVLGTHGTFREKLYTRACAQYGITCVDLSKNDQSSLDRVIYGPRGIKRIGKRTTQKKIVARIMKNLPKVSTIVLACTELSLLNIKRKNVVDPMDILIQTIVELEKENAS